jgi:hypothetical protein
MSLLSKLTRLWSDRLTSAAVAQQLVARLRTLTPDLAWVPDEHGTARSSVAFGNRMIVMLEDSADDVEARIVEPGQPGDDDPPLLLRAAYDVTNLAHSLSWRARVAPGTVVLHALRANAVYEVVREFTDHGGRAFSAGTRLTFVQRRFLPYHGGHTLSFREATVYLQEDSDVCRAFERYFAVATPK